MRKMDNIQNVLSKKLCWSELFGKLFQQSLLPCLAPMSTKPVHRYPCKARRYNGLKEIFRKCCEIRKEIEKIIAKTQPNKAATFRQKIK